MSNIQISRSGQPHIITFMMSGTATAAREAIDAVSQGDLAASVQQAIDDSGINDGSNNSSVLIDADGDVAQDVNFTGVITAVDQDAGDPQAVATVGLVKDLQGERYIATKSVFTVRDGDDAKAADPHLILSGIGGGVYSFELVTTVSMVAGTELDWNITGGNVNNGFARGVLLFASSVIRVDKLTSGTVESSIGSAATFSVKGILFVNSTSDGVVSFDWGNSAAGSGNITVAYGKMELVKL